MATDLDDYWRWVASIITVGVEGQQIADDRFPNKCPKCNSPAYIGFTAVECSREGCK